MARSIALPLAVFLIVSAVASPLLARLQEVTGLNPDVLRLTVVSTAVGAVVVGLIWRRALPRPPVSVVGVDRSLGVAFALSILGVGLMAALAHLQGAPWRPPAPAALGAPLSIVLGVQLLGAAAEEVGWRGLVQPMLETRLAPWAAALITGALFGLGHFYIAFAVPPLAFVLFLISAVALSMILALATVGRSLAARTGIATVLHFLINTATYFLFADGDGSVRYFTTLTLAFGASGLVATLLLVRRTPLAAPHPR